MADAAAQHGEKLRRSVTALERLYAAIGGFGITLGVKSAMDTFLNERATSHDKAIAALLFVALILTQVPFFHGSIRHMDEGHLYAPLKPSPRVLLFDYSMLYLEAVAFVGLALSEVHLPTYAHLVVALLVVDAIWAFVTLLIQRSRKAKFDYLLKWLSLDIVTLILIWILRCFVNQSHWPVAFAVGGFIRTIIDYRLGWTFYFDTGKRSIDLKLKPVPTIPEPLNCASWPRVSIESRLYADTQDEIDQNVEFAKLACRVAVAEKLNPFAMHLFFTRFLDDGKENDRKVGIGCGHGWTKHAEEVWFCLTPNQKTLSSGMMHAYDFHAARRDKPNMRVIRIAEDGTIVRRDEDIAALYHASKT